MAHALPTHAELPFSSAAQQNHVRTLNDPDRGGRDAAMASMLKRSLRPGMMAYMGAKSLAGQVCKAYRDGPASLGFRDNFEVFRDEDDEWDLLEWGVKNMMMRAICDGAGKNWKKEFYPICYTYLLDNNELGGEGDNFGGVVLAEESMERFFIFNYYDDTDIAKYHTLNERRGRELMSLLIYLGIPNVRWVRSTYLIPGSRTIPDGFIGPLSELDKAPSVTQPHKEVANPDVRESWLGFAAPWVHVTSEDFVGGIRFGSYPRLELDLLEQFGGFEQLGGGVEGRLTRKEQTTAPGSMKCDECGKVAETAKDLQRCSACKFDNYCSTACQKKAWPYHKSFCTGTVKKQKAAAARHRA